MWRNLGHVVTCDVVPLDESTCCCQSFCVCACNTAAEFELLGRQQEVTAKLEAAQHQLAEMQAKADAAASEGTTARQQLDQVCACQAAQTAGAAAGPAPGTQLGVYLPLVIKGLLAHRLLSAENMIVSEPFACEHRHGFPDKSAQVYWLAAFLPTDPSSAHCCTHRS